MRTFEENDRGVDPFDGPKVDGALFLFEHFKRVLLFNLSSFLNAPAPAMRRRHWRDGLRLFDTSHGCWQRVRGGATRWAILLSWVFDWPGRGANGLLVYRIQMMLKRARL